MIESVSQKKELLNKVATIAFNATVTDNAVYDIKAIEAVRWGLKREGHRPVWDCGDAVYVETTEYCYKYPSVRGITGWT